jgi:signal peptidase I
VNLSPDDYHDLLADLLGRGLSCATRMHGRSMSPAICDGDLVTLQPAPPDQLRPGDILLFLSAAGRPLCHRLLRLRRRGGQRWIQTWGDGSPHPDAPVPVANVLGRVERVQSEGGEVAREALGRGFRQALLRRRMALRLHFV